VNGRKLMLVSGATAALLICQIASATEAPGPAVAVLQYCLLAGALLGLVGSPGIICNRRNDPSIGHHPATANRTELTPTP
jgi:hypothetical protein